jgi:hypothetical protein
MKAFLIALIIVLIALLIYNKTKELEIIPVVWEV